MNENKHLDSSILIVYNAQWIFGKAVKSHFIPDNQIFTTVFFLIKTYAIFYYYMKLFFCISSVLVFRVEMGSTRIKNIHIEYLGNKLNVYYTFLLLKGKTLLNDNEILKPIGSSKLIRHSRWDFFSGTSDGTS